MRQDLRLILHFCCCFLLLVLARFDSRAVIRDGGIDPANLGKGDWIYFMSDATNRLGGNVQSVTNENSLMLFYKSEGIRYIIIKAATSDFLFNGSYNRPQFTSNLCNIAHAHGILIFGYNRSYGENVLGEIAISDYVFRQGADGFVWDAEAEWESSSPWIGSSGPAKAWQLCSTVRSNWPTKFLAHAPFPIISWHTSFPYKEFGYWSDTVMPQIYHFGWTGVKRSPSGAINWSDVNWHDWQNSLYSLPPTNISGLTVYWTNAIKPLAPINHVYGPDSAPAASPIPDKDVLEFIDYLAADPNPPTPGGYKGVSFWRADLHGPVQFSHIKNATSGSFTGMVNHVVIDSPNATASGPWTSIRTFYNGSFFAGTTDTNSFGTNYLMKGKGTGSAYVQFTPTIVVPGDYNVYEWHPRRTDASSYVPFLIAFNGGSNVVYANQQTNSGNWSLLGKYNFATGTSGYVRVLDNVAEPSGVTMADAIKFEFVNATLAPAAPTGLTAKAISPTQIDLTWKDLSTDETNFVVLRGTRSGGPYTNIATLPANTTNYSNFGLLPTNTYYYVVRAVNLYGASTNSNQAVATTLSPAAPSIMVQPRSQAVLLGQNVTLSVTALGSQPLRYQWRLADADIPGATNSNFPILNVQPSHSGVYSVVVTNAYGVITSSNATLAAVRVGIWGDNSSGQATAPLDATNIIAVAAGGWHNIGLRTDGSVVTWGNNFSGQATNAAGLSSVIAITAGGYHSLAIREGGAVVGWGANDYGQVTVPAGLKSAIAVAAGKWHSLALRLDGTVAGWGDNSWEQAEVPEGLSEVVAIAAGGNHSLALRRDGKVVAWGENTDFAGAYSGQSTVPLHVSNVVAIAAGAYHSLALTQEGSVAAWGDNSQNQCGVPEDLTGVIAIAAGGAHSLALKTDGTIVAWGANWNGQCNLPGNLSNAMGISAGEQHTLVFLEGTLPVPRLLSATRNGAGFGAVAQTLARRSYALEFNESLASSNWTAISTSRGNGALKVLSDFTTTAAQRFYRMRQW